MSKLVWSYGGGTQSAAIGVLILQGKLPRPDIIVMADTSREVTETWQYLSNVVQPAFDAAGMIVHVASHDYSTVDLQAQNGDVLIPVFTKGASIGKLPTFCSDKWKKMVVRRWLKDNGVKDCDVWLGMSTDEVERMKPSGLQWYRHVYPLIEILPTSRHQCVSIVERHGWPTPPKSRCWMCPNMGPQAWRQLRDQWPDDFAKAVALEQEIHLIDPDMYLHKLAIPLTEAVERSDMQSDLFDGCDSGYCFT